MSNNHYRGAKSRLIGFFALICFSLLFAASEPQAAWGQKTPASSSTTPPSAGAAAQYGVAARFQKLEQFDLSAQEWRKLVADFPDDPLAAAGEHYAGICDFQQGDYPQAIASFERFVQKYPKHKLLEATLTNQGLAQYNLAQAAKPSAQAALYQQALVTFDRRRKEFPQSSLARESDFYRGETLFALGKQAEAAKAYREWIAQHGDDKVNRLIPKVRLALGDTLTELGDYPAAIKVLSELLRQKPSPEIAPVASLRLGEALLGDSQFAKAAEAFASATASLGFVDADYALERQATALFQTGDYAKAGVLYESLSAKFPQSPLIANCQASAGKCYYQAKQYKKAAKLLRTAVEANPNEGELAHWAVRAFLEAGDPSTALQVANQALTHQKRSDQVEPQMLLDQADALYEIPSRRGDSIASYLAAADAAQGELAAEARHLAAATALELGQFEVAGKQAQLLIDTFPQSTFATDARQTLAEARLLSGAPKEAVALYRGLLQTADEQQKREWSLRLAWALNATGDDAAVAKLLSPEVGRFQGKAQQQARYLLGKAWFRTKQFKKAMKPLQLVATSQPTSDWSAEAALLLARSQIQMSDLPAAIATLNQLIATSPEANVASQAYYRRGEVFANQGKVKAAQKDYQKVAADWPESQLAPYANYRWALLASGLGNDSGAAQRFEQLLAAYPKHQLAEESRLAWANCLSRLGEHTKSLEALSSLPVGDPRVALARGTSLAETGKLKEAVAALQLAVNSKAEDFADRDRAWYELGWTYRRAKQPEDSRQAFEHLLKNFPQSTLAADAAYRVGESFYDAGNYAAAVEPFRLAAAKQGADTTLQEKAQHLVAWSLLKQKQGKAAATEFQKQLAESPQGTLAPDAKWLVGEAYFQAGDFTKGLEAFGLARDAKPTSTDLVPLGLLHAGQAAGQLGQWQVSADWLGQVVKDYPDYAGRSEVDFELGIAQMKLNQTVPAMTLFQKVADSQRSPLGARARFMEGELLFAQKEHENAVRSFFKVAYGYGAEQAPAEFHPWQAESLFEAARCLEQLNRRVAASKLYAELLQRFPKQEKAKLAQKRLEELQAANQ